MNPADKTPTERRARPRRTITITLSLPTAVSSLIMLCVGFICVFSIGILLGRGHNLEANIPQLERLMPQAAPTEQPRLIDRDSDPIPPPSEGNPQAASGVGEERPAASSSQAAGQTAARQGNASLSTGGQGDSAASRNPAARQPPPQDARNRVMDQGDLAYRESLKQKPAPPASRRAASGQTKQPAAKAGTTAQPPAGTAAKQPPPAAGQDVFNYVYQVAAYKNGGMSDKLASKLKAAGLKARTEKSVENGTTWYKTLVDFRGSPDDTNTLRAKLNAQGFTRLILRSKVPAKP